MTTAVKKTLAKWRLNKTGGRFTMLVRKQCHKCRTELQLFLNKTNEDTLDLFIILIGLFNSISSSFFSHPRTQDMPSPGRFKAFSSVFFFLCCCLFPLLYFCTICFLFPFNLCKMTACTEDRVSNIYFTSYLNNIVGASNITLIHKEKLKIIFWCASVCISLKNYGLKYKQNKFHIKKPCDNSHLTWPHGFKPI